MSLDFITRTGVGKDGRIIDVGGGTSTLVDDLLDQGYRHITVLDISGAAISKARTRLGERAERMHWIEADITSVELQGAYYAIWHDRAVFHFLTAAKDREQYVLRANAAIRPGGHLIIATFASDGPQQCSGLDVARYSPQELQAEIGDDFDLVEARNEEHPTPFGALQKFVYCRFQKRG